MAKRIIISFTDNPILGTALNLGILVNDLAIIYNSGEAYMSIDYDTTDTIPNKIQLQDNLNDTINKTLAFLIANWTADFISYKRVNDTIEMLILADDITVSIGALNANISVIAELVSDNENLNLRYYFQYTNNVNDTFLCQIFKKYYLGDSLEIHGKATLEKGSVSDHLDSIRGTGLSLELEADLNVTLEDLYTQDEQDFTVKFYKNNKIIFRGFLKPDGIYQSFVRDAWVLNLDCVDGLGALSNLSFVRDNGTRFIGKEKASDIVYYCLKRTGILLPINTSINTLYDGLTPSDNLDILTKIQLNADRFFKNDSQSTGDGTLMSCEEVLKSVLDIFCACITQENGEWYIYKANEIYKNPYVLFRRYDIDNVYLGNKTINLNKVLGSQIDNFYPHHCSGNQRIEIKGGVSAFRLGYKYGFVSGLFPNSLLIHDNSLNYEGWDINETNFSYLINDPLDDSGFKITPDTTPSSPIKLLATSDSILLNKNDTFNFKVTVKANGSTRFFFRIRHGLYSMDVNGVWVLDSVSFAYIQPQIFGTEQASGGVITKTYDIPSLPLPNDGSVFVEVYVAKSGTLLQNPLNATMAEVSNLDLINTFAGDSVIGEFHTVSRTKKVSSIVKENKSVANGDNAGIVYLGAIFKEDGITPTQTWSRSGSFENYPLLRIAAEEELRIAQKPLKVFKGSAFGFMPYFSYIDINNIEGKFFPIEYSYDTKNNITDFKLLELFSAEIPDILYKFTYDYGNTVKPTIVG